MTNWEGNRRMDTDIKSVAANKVYDSEEMTLTKSSEVTPTQEVLDAQEKYLSITQELVYTLEKRLDGVLLPAPTDLPDDEARSPGSSALVNRINNHNSYLIQANGRLRYLIDRLEV